MPDSRELSYSECEAFLRAGVAGRVAMSTPGGPQIVPVNYSVVDNGIIIRTSPYSLLGTYGRDTMLAFEIDQFDHPNQRGWSVVARGRAGVVQDPKDLEHIRSVWEPQPWASGVRALFIRIRLAELTGRQLGAGWDPMRDLAVYRVV